MSSLFDIGAPAVEIAAVYLSGDEEEVEGGQVRILLGAGSYFTLDEGSGLQVLEYFQRHSTAPGAKRSGAAPPAAPDDASRS